MFSRIDDDGWMHSGDIAVIDEDGYANITGRVKDMIVRGGENVYPAEIEGYLYQHPSVQEVQVFGIPDQTFGEEVCAWIVLKDGVATSEEDIIAFCKHEIAHYKIPHYIQFHKELPMTITGKPQKFKMAESMIRQLGIEKIATA